MPWKTSRPATEPVLVLVMLLVTLIMALNVHRAAAAAPVTMQTVRQIVDQYLSANPNYRRGDVLTRDDIEPIFNDLMSLGFQPFDDSEDMYDSFLPTQATLVGELRSANGTRFMRQVCQIPGAYDRLERLSWIPEGRAMLEEMIMSPHGADQFRKVCTPEGIKRVSEALAADQRGKNFALATGHIYNEDQLLKRLQDMLKKHPPH